MQRAYGPNTADAIPGMDRRNRRKDGLTAGAVSDSARFVGKDEDLARINAVRISDLAMVRVVNDRISRAVPIGGTADAPQTIAPRHNRSGGLRHRHSGERGGAWHRRRIERNLGARSDHAGAGIHFIQSDPIITAGTDTRIDGKRKSSVRGS